ncbi:substrate-binding periplasmic protein [Undibacterium sp. Ji49W]|uniref:substrate-binding periplasmic protein n=1 Tax=Undibacterium sp. Ji49W TaxID=3413040 RepID=UPI003BEFA1A3
MAACHAGLSKVAPGLLRAMLASCFCVLLCASAFSFAGEASQKSSLKYFPVGPIYEYRWKLLELALAHTRDEAADVRLEPFAEDVTQNRGISLLQSGAIDVIALGTNTEREAQMLPVKIDILRGIIGYRVLVIRKADQASIALMDEQALRQQLTFGLNSQWADLAILRANGFTVVTSTNYENLFGMLAGGRFDAFTRGLNEAYLEIEKHKAQFPQLTTEKSKALYFPYPVYFWVRKDNKQLASRIERGLKLALADGSFRRLFESYHAKEIKQLASERRQLIRLANPVLPADTLEPDTRWWWH